MKIYFYLYIFVFGLLISACESLKDVPYVALKADFSPSQSLVQLGTPITFNQLSTEVAKKFEWDFGNGVQSTEASPVYTYPKIGKYNVKLTVTKADGITKNITNREVLIIPKTENATQFITMGEASQDESGYCFTRQADKFIFAGRKGLNTLTITYAELNLNQFTITNSLVFDFPNITQGKVVPRDIKIARSGGLIIVGNLEYTQSDSDSFVLKIDADGKEEWRVVNATGRYEQYNSVIDLVDIFLVAGTVSTGSGSQNTKIVADLYTTDGILDADFTDGNNWQTNDVVFTNEGFALAVTEGNEPSLIRYNASFLQPKKSNLDFIGKGLGVTQLNDGSFVLVGERTHSADSTSAFIARFDGFGNRMWLKNLSYFHDSYFGVYQNTTGEIIAVGNHYNPISQKDVLISKYNLKGDLLSSRIIGGMKDDISSDIDVTNVLNDNIFILGNTQSFGKGLRDLYFIRLDKDLK